MKTALACDHGGYLLKNEIISKLKETGFEVEDFGCYSTESVDYPDYAFPAAEAVAAGKADRCILICTTGIGVSICANKVKGIRCALCTSEFQAEMTRRHNNANALAMGAKTVSAETAWNIAKKFLETEFEGGRHERRVQKIMDHAG